MKKLLIYTYLVPMLCVGMLISGFTYYNVEQGFSLANAEERSVTVKPKEKRDLSVEAKKGLDTVLLNTKYYAIIVGNNNYKHLPKLKTAIADAKSVDEILKNQYGFQTKLLTDATRKDILSAMNEFRKRLGEKDSLLIYYAGHGTFEKAANKAYWLPVDAQVDDNTDWIIVDDITSNIKIIASRHILIVSDSCYAGTMTRSISTELSTPAREEFIKKMMERPSRTLMASGGNEPVADEGGGGHSVFAGSLLKALSEFSEKGVFTAEELFHGRVKESVAGKSDQVPEYNNIKNSGHDGGDFVFRLAKLSDVDSVSIPVDIPEVKVKEAPKTDFSLEDLDKKAKQIEDNKAAWGNTLNKMQGAFNQVAEYQKRDIEKDLKIAAWSKFLNSFTEDNPYSNEDEAMRQKARQEIEKWQKVAMATGVIASDRDTVTGMELIHVRGGCYQMGDTFGDGDSDEKPIHEVCVDDFYMGKYEVTVGEFREFVNATGYRTEAEQGDGCYVWTGSAWEKDRNKNWRNLGFSQDDRHPAACVSWNDSIAYTDWLSGKSGNRYRLPTEAEWEYAARSGGRSEKYSGGNNIDSVAWYGSNSGRKTHPVGQKETNGLGLYDMTGNVWEWTNDWYADDYYRKSPKNNPEGASSGQNRVLRGGSWDNSARNTRAAVRSRSDPDPRRNHNGFRVVRTN